MTNVLIIGGSRFLGRSIALNFLAAGNYNVCVMNRGTRENLPGLAADFKCDKADRESFRKVLLDRAWDFILDTILSDEDLAFLIDSIGSDVGHFIHTGSIGVYGDARRIPVPEWLPMAEQPEESGNEDRIFNYKIRQDKVLQRAYNERKFPMSILRMSNIYGPGDVPLDGIGSRKIDYWQRLSRGEKVEVVENGRALLQPGHVDDLARAFLQCAERPQSIGQVYNIGGNWSLMLKDYIPLAAKAMGAPKAELEFVSRQEVAKRYGQADDFICQHMCSDISKAARELQWFPKIPLEAGLRNNFNWMREQGNL